MWSSSGKCSIINLMLYIDYGGVSVAGDYGGGYMASTGANAISKVFPIFY